MEVSVVAWWQQLLQQTRTPEQSEAWEMNEGMERSQVETPPHHYLLCSVDVSWFDGGTASQGKDSWGL